MLFILHTDPTLAKLYTNIYILRFALANTVWECVPNVHCIVKHPVHHIVSRKYNVRVFPIRYRCNKPFSENVRNIFRCEFYCSFLLRYFFFVCLFCNWCLSSKLLIEMEQKKIPHNTKEITDTIIYTCVEISVTQIISRNNMHPLLQIVNTHIAFTYLHFICIARTDVWICVVSENNAITCAIMLLLVFAFPYDLNRIINK